MPRQNLTANACTVCRKKRTKCDGRHPCRRCTARREDCVYEDKMWRTKDHLRSEIERLRKEIHQCNGLIKALTPPGAADEWTTIQSRMHRGEPPERIAEWLASLSSPSTEHHDSSSNAVSPETGTKPRPDHCRRRDAAGFTMGSLVGMRDDNPHDHEEVSGVRPTWRPPASSSFRDKHRTSAAPGLASHTVSEGSKGSICSSSYSQSVNTPDTMAPSSEEFLQNMTNDEEPVNRLLRHYFDSCFPDFSFICEERFVGDMRAGTGVYSSAALANAILGLASQSYDPFLTSEACDCSAGRFLAKSNELLRGEQSQPTITSIQALGVLALAELNLRNEEAAFRLSVDCARSAILLKMEADTEEAQTEDLAYREAMATTFCGAFTLTRIFRLLTGQLSFQTGPLFMRLAAEDDQARNDSPTARVERGVVLQQHFFNVLDDCPELLKFIYTVTEIAHTFCCYHYDDAVTPADLVPTYTRCLQAWERFNAWLPSGSEISENVLFAQIWYNYVLTVVFSTLIDDPVDLRQGVTPKSVAIQASEAVVLLAGIYRDHCGFSSVHPLLPHMVFATTLFQLRRSFAKEGIQGRASGIDDRRKQLSEPHTPVLSNMPPLYDLSFSDDYRRRGDSAVGDAVHLVYPTWKFHITAATMSRHGVANGSNSGTERSAELSPRPAPKVAAEGILRLTEMGRQYPKAAELAHILRARSAASVPAMNPTTAIVRDSFTAPTMPPSMPCLWTPGWDSKAWGAGNGGGTPGFGGPGVDSLQGFSTLTMGLAVQNGHAGGVVDDGSRGYVTEEGPLCSDDANVPNISFSHGPMFAQSFGQAPGNPGMAAYFDVSGLHPDYMSQRKTGSAF